MNVNSWMVLKSTGQVLAEHHNGKFC